MFEKVFGRAPSWRVRAPGRVNLIGEHTDYNGGFVLPMAIERFTEISAAPNNTGTVVLHSAALQERICLDLSHRIEPDARGAWTNYPRGVLAGFLRAGLPLQGFDAVITSTVPLGSGLSSSASLDVAFCTLLEVVSGCTLDPVRKVRLCQQAEHEYAGVPCGLMDPFVCTLGRENQLALLDCREEAVQWVRLTDPTVAVLIVQSNVRHKLAGGEYAVRRRQCEAAARQLNVPLLRDATASALERARAGMDDVIYRRARHVITENDRTQHAARALIEHRWLDAGQLMYSSHASLCDNFEVSCPELDAIVEIAQNIGPKGGVYGCRMTGGGFGGCAVALIQSQLCDRIIRTLEHEYEACTGLRASAFVSRPADGATRMPLSQPLTQSVIPAA